MSFEASHLRPKHKLVEQFEFFELGQRKLELKLWPKKVGNHTIEFNSFAPLLLLIGRTFEESWPLHKIILNVTCYTIHYLVAVVVVVVDLDVFHCLAFPFWWSSWEWWFEIRARKRPCSIPPIVCDDLNLRLEMGTMILRLDNRIGWGLRMLCAAFQTSTEYCGGILHNFLGKKEWYFDHGTCSTTFWKYWHVVWCE